VDAQFIFISHFMGQIDLRHVQWLCDMGEELERQCDFSAALKYYYAGNAYFAKLDGFNIEPASSTNTDHFDHLKLYETMCNSLQAVAVDEKYSEWVEQHPGVVLSGDFDLIIRIRHLKHCLNLASSETNPCLQHVRE
jgi:hypothetical protein